ncbi:MAG: hypothetical protein PHT51_05250 [Patescibacteria group bacterium]|nr:hypothetical protein [Patescibacteria group bacterium]MDD4611353.1 hypothetical protein [Patescibacteria group bacterium]
MLGTSLSFDPELGNVLVAAPSGMQTPFWGEERNTSEYLDPKWVAERIMELANEPLKYCYAKILRKPNRVEIIESRK